MFACSMGFLATADRMVTRQVQRTCSRDESTERVWPEGQADWLVLEVAHRDLPLCIETILERVDRIAPNDALW